MIKPSELHGARFSRRLDRANVVGRRTHARDKASDNRATPTPQSGRDPLHRQTCVRIAAWSQHFDNASVHCDGTRNSPGRNRSAISLYQDSEGTPFLYSFFTLFNTNRPPWQGKFFAAQAACIDGLRQFGVAAMPPNRKPHRMGAATEGTIQGMQ